MTSTLRVDTVRQIHGQKKMACYWIDPTVEVAIAIAWHMDSHLISLY